jgi:hypothetical protein
MTKYDQAALFVVLIVPFGITMLWAMDQILERVDETVTRNRTWRAIDRRCAMERHPSSRAALFDQDAE